MLQLSDIVGQDAAIEHLRAAMAHGRLPHALLFAGPAGVGRQTTATALAAALLCGEPRQVRGARQGCGRCDDCRTLTAGTHPDFHRVYKELAAYHPDPKVRDRVMQELGIDVIRDFLIVPAGRAPSRGRGRVFCVLEAELMSIEAQNCLLKTLEEPPRGVMIILVCRRVEELLPTTVSRCRLVRFGPLPRAFVLDRLAEAGVGAAQAEFWSRYTAGSLGEALRLAAGGLYEVKRELVGRLAAMDAGGDPELAERLVRLTEELGTASVQQARTDSGVDLSKSLATRQAVGTVLGLLASVFRDALHLRCAPPGGPAEPLAHADQADAIAAVAGRFAPEELARIIEQLAQYEDLLWRNVSTKLLWDNAVITCAAAAPLGL